MVLVFQPSRPAGKKQLHRRSRFRCPASNIPPCPGRRHRRSREFRYRSHALQACRPLSRGRDRMLWRLKSHIGNSFPPAWCPGLSMPPITPAVTSRSKNSADTRWTFDGEGLACLLRIFPSCFPKVCASTAAFLCSCCRPVPNALIRRTFEPGAFFIISMRTAKAGRYARSEAAPLCAQRLPRGFSGPLRLGRRSPVRCAESAAERSAPALRQRSTNCRICQCNP